MIDSGGFSRKSCVAETSKICIKCENCFVTSGFGGCISIGTAAKLVFPPCGKRLDAYFGSQKYAQFGKDVWQFYSQFAGINKPYPVVNADYKELGKLVAEYGLKLFDSPVHTADEKELNLFLTNFKTFLEKNTKIVLGKTINLVKDVNPEEKLISLDGDFVKYKKLVIATGRAGYQNTKEFLDRFNAYTEDENISVGMRVLLPRDILLPVSSICPDFKVKETVGNLKMETFCFSNGAYGGKIKYLKYPDNFTNLDGHICVSSPGNCINGILYGNFAILAEDTAQRRRYLDMQNIDEVKIKTFLEKILSIIAKMNRTEVSEIKKHMFLLKWEIENIWPRIKADNGFWVSNDIAVIGDCSGLAQGIVSSLIMGYSLGEQNDQL